MLDVGLANRVRVSHLVAEPENRRAPKVGALRRFIKPKASKVTSGPTLPFSREKVHKILVAKSGRIRKHRNCARLERIWNMDFQRQIEIELFEIRRSYLRDPGLVVGSIARVLLQGMNLALHSRHLVI
jgi:hypothetical protein